MENQILLKPWMISQLVVLLSKEYQERLKTSGLDKVLAVVAKKEGLARAKEIEEQYRDNRFTEIGQIWTIIKTLDQISTMYVNELKK